MPQTVPRAERGPQAAPALEELERLLSSDRVQLVGSDASVADLPDALAKLLAQAIGELRRGYEVTVLRVNDRLTTQQAAEILNVSRPYLIRLLTQGEIPYDMVGTHRRIGLADVLDFKARRSRQRRDALRRLSEDADELGIYVE